jgi:hypothetical protein
MRFRSEGYEGQSTQFLDLRVIEGREIVHVG